ncbi:hypothetical protein FB451DRAFT_1370558 [Mycena latifolia]|nr:hypothetical protein FB451DRAFT_1370558 [Mycena latifolia]
MSGDDIHFPDSEDIETLSNFICNPQISELLESRLNASEPSSDNPLIAAMISVLATPALTSEAAHSKQMMWWNVLSDLPKDRLEPYRGALTRLATQPSEAEAATGLPQRSAETLEFLDASHASQAWVPRNKSDHMSIRSLDLLVQTPEEMRPFVPGLLEWLQDPNWPPYSTCSSQLERFPEVAIDPIREVLRRGDDGWWEGSLLEFLLYGVPGEIRERARVEVERIAQRPTPQEVDVFETANECLKEMDHWAARAKILPRKKTQRT